MLFRQLNPGACRTYLIASERTKEAVLVDPTLGGAEAALARLRSEGLKLRWVIDTHTHADHLSGSALIRERAQVPYLMHVNSEVRCVTNRVRERDVLSLGEVAITFLHAPGHTRDSLMLRLPDRLLSGDFLFIGEDAAGRLDLPGCSVEDHYRSLRKLDALPDASLLFPAHDYRGKESSTIGQERRTNPILQPRSRDEYFRWWQERRLEPADWMKDVLAANAACATDPAAAAIPAEGGRCSPGAACAAPAAGVPILRPDELRQRAGAPATRVFVLDVREPDEYTGELGHIEGSRLIPLAELETRVAEVPRDRTVVAVCKSGGRSSRAAAMLRGRGYEDVYSLAGGMKAWNEARLPVER